MRAGHPVGLCERESNATHRRYRFEALAPAQRKAAVDGPSVGSLRRCGRRNQERCGACDGKERDYPQHATTIAAMSRPPIGYGHPSFAYKS